MQRAFSLVELSIVLVILGLLTGGILAGQSLIRASELRATVAEVDKIKTSTNNFRDKYMGVPGDFTNATKFWGIAGGNASDNYTVTCAGNSSTTATCNGDGDGVINAIFTNPNHMYEEFTFWQHLGRAGLIEGSYNGMGEALTPGLNVLGSKLPNAGWRILDFRNFGGTAQAYALDYGVTFYLAELSVGGGVLTPPEAWNIDTKIDDGRPAYGTVIAGRFPWCTTSTSQTDRAGNYALTSSNRDCGLYFSKIY